MKKKIFSLVAIAAISLGAWNYSENQNSVEFSDLALENIDALASGEYGEKIWIIYNRPEGNGYNCTKGGKEICF